MRAANLAVRFLLELFALAALGYWGATWAGSPAMRVLLGVGAPLIAAVFWGMFVAPRARVILPTPIRMALGLLVFAAAAGALTVRGEGRLAAGFLTIAVVNVVLMIAWRQDRPISRDVL